MKIFYALLIGSLVTFSSCSNCTDDSKKISDSEVVNETRIPASAEFNMPDGKYTVTKIAPSVTWAANKLGGSGHSGTIKVENGKFKVENGVISVGIISMNMNSFTVTDLEGEDKANFDGHLKSEDFLDVEKYPTAELTINGMKIIDRQVTLNTSFKLHGAAVDYNVPVTIKHGSKDLGVVSYSISGEFFVDRTKHKIVYGSGSFFDNLGDRAINDEVLIKFDFTAL